MPRLEPRKPPPPDYYADNLSFLIGEVARRNADLLDAAELRFIAAWRAAGTGARRLFARLLTRKGPWIRADRLDYAEVDDLPAALYELAARGLVRLCPTAPADRLLALCTRAELDQLFPRIRAGTKQDWIAACIARYPDSAIRAVLGRARPWLEVAQAESEAVCRLLFFGSDRQDLTDFVLQDLGVVRFERYEVGTRTRPFADRAELEAYRACRRLEGWVEEAARNPALAAAIRDRLRAPTGSRSVARLRDRVLNRLGQAHERRREFDAALESYALSGAHPARERRARLLRRLGDETGFAALVARMVTDPWCAAEEDYARRMCPALAAAGDADAPVRVEVMLSDTGPVSGGAGRIEAHALTWLGNAETTTGWHLENLFPLGLAGLVFWDVVFAPVAGAFSHPLQHGPRDLFWPDFARVRAGLIAARVAELADPPTFRHALVQTYTTRHGTANRLVNWNAWSPALLDAVLGTVHAARAHQPLLALAGYAIRHLERARTGFPDLTTISADGTLGFVEVKGPTDQLQPAQRVWLRKLVALGFPARVLQFR